MNESRPPNNPPDSDRHDADAGDAPESAAVNAGGKREPSPADADQSADREGAGSAGASADDTTEPETDPSDTQNGSGETGGTAETEPTTVEETGHTADGGGTDGAASEGTGEGDHDQRGGGSGSRVVALIALIALVGAAVLGGIAWHLHERLEAVEARVAEVPSERERIIQDAIERVDVRRELDDLAARLADETDAREALGGEFEDRSEELSAAIADVRELAVGHHTRWRLAEVRYLVSIGVRRLQLAEDPDGAAAAFEAADEALHLLSDARLLDLRAMLVEDIARIRALEPADVEGIALRLRNLERAVERLPIASEERPVLEPLDPDGPIWEQIVERLRGLVVVRHRDAEPEADLLDDADGLTPREAVSLALRQARLAALNGDSARYEQALGAARDALATHFDAEARMVTEFGERIDRLAERPVRLEIPDLQPTLDRVAAVTARLEAERERAREAAGEAPSGGDE